MTFVIFPNPKISIIIQTHMHSRTYTLRHSLIRVKEAEKCHKWTQLLNSIFFLIPAPLSVYVQCLNLQEIILPVK